MKQKIRDMSIKKKLVFYSYLFITPILLIISAALFAKNYSKNQKEQRETYQKNVENLSDGIDTMLNGMMEMGTYICINQEIATLLQAEDVSALNQDSQVWLHQAPMHILQDMIALSGQIKTLAIYPENGLKPYLRCMDASSYLGDMKTVRQQEIYQEVHSQKGKAVFAYVSKNGRDTYEANRTGKIVMYREIYDRAKKTPLGYVVIGASAEKYIQLCENSLPMDSAGIVVVNEEENELVRVGNVEEAVLEEILQDDALSGNYGDYYIYGYKSSTTKTAVYEMIHKDDIRSQMWNIAAAPAALLFGFLIGLYPVLMIVSNIVSKPLKKLCTAMEEFQQGDFNRQVEVMTGDEVGEAAACFNQMVEAIRELIDKNYVMALREKESELNALQAQINPHFLYNTLDSLYWRAVEEDQEELAEDILALSNLFRLVLGQGTGITTIANESALLEHYLHIQKMRFSQNLDYEILMSEEILEEQIPKLILQPFVENAVVHGFEKGGEKCLVRITGEREGDYICFKVEDNGIGMSEEQIQKIWETPDTRPYAGQRIGRYAIKNVRERLDLKYHADFKLEIESKVGVGTCVTIKIPWRV